MATRIKEGMIPYKGWIWIEITENHIINVLLREANNLIHVNDNNELYVDLQLDDGIQPDDDFPVGVTTGRILQEDWWQQSWLILNWKTTSWDYARIIYANDWNVYIDLWDWVWRQIGIDISEIGNVKAFYPTDLNETTEWQAMVDWYLAGKYPIVVYRWESYILEAKPMSQQIRFYDIHSTVMHLLDNGYSYSFRNALYATWDVNNEFQWWLLDQVQISPSVLATDIDYQTPYAPQYLWSPTTKHYVDTELLKKQDLLTPWTRITIQTDPVSWDLVISADVSGVMTYMWNVTDASQLPTTWQNQWDCWYAETEKTMYAWDGTQWNDIGWTGIDLTNYFNLNVNTSDDITEWSIHLFCTAIEKNYWDNKQDPLTAGTNITIDANNVISAVDTTYSAGTGIDITGTVISNDLPFDPENAWAMWQLLQKTSSWYKWINPNFVISVNNQTWVVTVDEFTPANQWTAGQVLKKTQDWYEWQNETAGQYTWDTWIQVNQASKTIKNTLPFSPTNTGRAGQVIKLNSDWVTYSWQNDESWWGGGWWGWGWGWNFNPDNTWQPWQVLTKKDNNRYDWEDITLPSGENNVKFWTIHSNNPSTQQMQEITEWVELDDNNGAILNDIDTKDVFVFYNLTTEGLSKIATFHWTKRISERIWRPNHDNWQYTIAYEQALTIDYTTSSQRYSMWVGQNPDSSTHTNYVSAFWAQYEAPFIPTNPSEPATKQYVDIAVAAWPSHVGGIVSNTTGTTSRVSSIWAWSKTELNNLSQRDPTCIYFSFNN